MQKRKRVKIQCFEKIYHKNQQIGRINMVSYLTGDSTPHIEYDLDKEFWNRGIMTKELAKYLRKYGKYHRRFIALMQKDNIASQKVLEKNNFFRVGELNNKLIYAIDLRLERELNKILK